MKWLRLSDETAQSLLELGEQHAPELGEQLLQDLNSLQPDPEQPWQDVDAAYNIFEETYSGQGVENSFNIDFDVGAVSASSDGMWVLSWVWISKEALEERILENVQDA